MLKPGLRMDFDRFIRSLHDINDKQKQQKEIVKQAEDIISLFKNLVNSYEFNESDDTQDNYSFLFAFTENICNNISKNKNNYRYSEIVQQFAQSLYILGGRSSYEFVRLNLPGALPSLSTLNLSLEKAGACIGEAEFRYDALNHHHNSLNYLSLFGYVISGCHPGAFNDYTNDACQFAILIVAFTSAFEKTSTKTWKKFFLKICLLAIATCCYIGSTRFLVKYLHINLVVQRIFNIICVSCGNVYLYNQYAAYCDNAIVIPPKKQQKKKKIYHSVT